ncbi:MAG: M23 family metallopeptidase [Alphaproteobacteria bacterium]|nr:M23 family metallopeptidase [Alphaproteobacteria bacterium]
MKLRAIYLIFSLLPFAHNVQADDGQQTIQICGNRAQGQILSGYAPNIEQVTLDGKALDIASNGKFMFAFSRDDKLNHKIVTTDFSGTVKTYDFPIKPTKWDIQNIKGIESKKVSPSPKAQAEIDKERTAIRGAMTSDSETTHWQNVFLKPVEGRTSGTFGGQRIMNGKKMNPHQGWDIAAKRGTPVKATNDGIITLSGDHNFFYSGNVVIIDHGYKLFTIYAHLDKTKAKIGDKVKKGDIIGTVGTTGRSTGPHLHWGASLNDVRFDPASFTKMHTNCSDL